MTAHDDVGRRLTAWFEADAGPQEPEYLLGSVLARTARTRRRPAWLIPERWMPMGTVMTATAPRVPWRMVALLALLLVGLVIGAALVAGSRPRPPQPRDVPPAFGPAANGLVAYSANNDIYTVDPASGDARALISGSGTDRYPIWSLDGRRIAFLRTHYVGWDLHVANADGSAETRITTERPVRIEAVSFSPDGTEVMYTSGEVPRISIAKVDGSGVRTLELPMAASQPSYRPPDGAQILFAGHPTDEPDPRLFGLYVVNADGTGLRTLLEPAITASAAPSWSPDGSLIAYDLVDLTDPSGTIKTHVMSADGSGDRTLPAPTDARWSVRPTWSNDGSHIAVTRGYSPPGGKDVVIAMVPVDGSGPGVETARGLLASQPSGYVWAPDDSWILVRPNPTGSLGRNPLLIDPLTGAGRTATWISNSDPTWQRVVPSAPSR